MVERGDRKRLRDEVLARLAALRQHQRDGRRSPHKPLLVLLALGRLSTAGSSALRWTDVQTKLGDLIAEFGPVSKTGRAQSAAYPFTRLRSDGVWTLDQDVPMDAVGPLTAKQVVGRFDPVFESALVEDPALIRSAARALVENHFPATVAPDVLSAVGFDPATVLVASGVVSLPAGAARRRDPSWRDAVMQAWDRQCAFCGYDGQAGGATVGIDAAHVRWFAYDGPDSLDNGLALCALHHKLFDRGVLGLDTTLRIHVSTVYTARTPAGRALYALHGLPLEARPGTPMPAATHVAWHRREVFKGEPLAVPA
ncbi:MAG TPA: HNH endonuclease [Micromonosporaceae bacterium]|nr:HNH endonuclease [Micromonosporaceae bacterium]